MKKALALVLALVLALSVATSALALDLVTLNPAKTKSPKPVELTPLENFADNKSVYVAGEGGVYYVLLDKVEYKDIEVVASGVGVTAKVVEYDPTVYEYTDKITYYVFDKVNGVVVPAQSCEAFKDADGNFYFGYENAWYYHDGKTGVNTKVDDWYSMNDVADILNNAGKTTQYVVKTDCNLDLIQITVEDNYGKSYTEGLVTVSATLAGKAVSGKIVIIRDVTIWDYETVKHAAKYDVALNTASDKGYSDYVTYCNDYLSAGLENVSVVSAPAVISTTAFRAVTGADLTIETKGMEVYIEEVQAGQGGVNFSAYGLTVVDANKDGKAESLDFGFLGEQKVLGDWTIALETGLNWFELRAKFGVKVEEDDVITYYILKDGKYYAEKEVDYMTIDPYKEVVVEIEGANDNLGEYSIVLEVPTTGAATEENPNTGAESVVGVVAALAVVSVATAAAVSLKK